MWLETWAKTELDTVPSKDFRAEVRRGGCLERTFLFYKVNTPSSLTNDIKFYEPMIGYQERKGGKGKKIEREKQPWLRTLAKIKTS